MTFPHNAGHPLHRPRRLRGHARLRDLVREHQLTVDDLIYPLFVYHGTNLRREIGSMPGQYQLSLDRLGEVVDEVVALGIPSVLLFGIPEHKDATGSAASLEQGIVQEAVRLIKRQALSSSSSRTSAFASTPTTAIAARWSRRRGGTTWTTTPPYPSWPSKP